jgi:hypothetical protein
VKRTLDAAAYWKLRATLSEAQRCLVVAEAARAALQAATRTQTALLAEMGIDPSAPSWTLDDDSLTITTPDAPLGEPPRPNRVDEAPG